MSHFAYEDPVLRPHTHQRGIYHSGALNSSLFRELAGFYKLAEENVVTLVSGSILVDTESFRSPTIESPTSHFFRASAETGEAHDIGCDFIKGDVIFRNYAGIDEQINTDVGWQVETHIHVIDTINIDYEYNEETNVLERNRVFNRENLDGPRNVIPNFSAGFSGSSEVERSSSDTGVVYSRDDSTGRVSSRFQESITSVSYDEGGGYTRTMTAVRNMSDIYSNPLTNEDFVFYPDEGTPTSSFVASRQVYTEWVDASSSINRVTASVNPDLSVSVRRTVTRFPTFPPPPEPSDDGDEFFEEYYEPPSETETLDLPFNINIEKVKRRYNDKSRIDADLESSREVEESFRTEVEYSYWGPRGHYRTEADYERHEPYALRSSVTTFISRGRDVILYNYLSFSLFLRGDVTAEISRGESLTLLATTTSRSYELLKEDADGVLISLSFSERDMIFMAERRLTAPLRRGFEENGTYYAQRVTRTTQTDDYTYTEELEECYDEETLETEWTEELSLYTRYGYEEVAAEEGLRAVAVSAGGESPGTGEVPVDNTFLSGHLWDITSDFLDVGAGGTVVLETSDNFSTESALLRAQVSFRGVLLGPR